MAWYGPFLHPYQACPQGFQTNGVYMAYTGYTSGGVWEQGRVGWGGGLHGGGWGGIVASGGGGDGDGGGGGWGHSGGAQVTSWGGGGGGQVVPSGGSPQGWVGCPPANIGVNNNVEGVNDIEVRGSSFAVAMGAQVASHNKAGQNKIHIY